ncbi:Gfo/Idh/MocA family protein [Gehongia tenuis]|uniref:Gfo/Idh/MocA family oxidoreductase n=1 Tax=Gehongia tenuis TaxID=2763655 RepID=A0A926HPN1_9FIRM|nr:Gfo/Idh/MocA family oxidoreductase [Gehongia tenuis]MBC8530361.1 Gfo/Idh/MocA family oxidoreductase [Gehongia tenuis]
MSKFRAVIVGLGTIHPMHAVSIGMCDKVELVAVCDNKEDRAKAGGERYGVPYYLDYKEMIDTVKPDVVHICLPHYMHYPVAAYALKAGCNVLSEKPMTIKYEDAVDEVKIARETGKTLGIISQNRYNPGSVLIKNAITSGKLGKIYSARAFLAWDRSDEYYSKSDWKGTWDKEGGGVIIDQAIHTLDLMRWFVDDEIDWVDATIDNKAHEIIEVEDVAEGVIAYKNGIKTSFYCMNYYTFNAEVEIEMHCEKGMVHMYKDRAVIKYNNGIEESAEMPESEMIDFGKGIPQYWGVSHFKQICQYYDALEKGVQPEINGEEAIKSMRMICAIYDSGKAKKRIVFGRDI